MKTKPLTSQQLSRSHKFGAWSNRRAIYVGLTVVGFAVIGSWLLTQSQAASIPASLNPAPSTRVLSAVELQDATVMQSFAFDTKNNIWIFAQVTQGGRHNLSGAQHASEGNLTLTKLSKSGKKLGYMYLKGFGHGVSIGVEPVGTKTFVWTEAGPVVGEQGTRIARFEWKDGVTITTATAGVTEYGVNNGALRQTPYVDAAANLIAVRYFSNLQDIARWAVYPLDRFKQRDYTPITRVTQPANQYTNPTVFQGWALNGTRSIFALSGTAYGPDNPKPGNAMLYETDTSTAKPTGSVSIKSFPDLTHREAEGLSIINGVLCNGFASGEPGARKANIICQRAL